MRCRNSGISIGSTGSRPESSRTKSEVAKTFTVFLAPCIVAFTRPAEEPKRSDESMKANKVIAGSVIALVLLASSPFILRLIWPRINEVKTGATPEYPDIQPQRFYKPHAEVFPAALDAAKSMGWDIREY